MRSNATRGSLPSKLMSAVVPLRPTPATRIGKSAIEPTSRTGRSESVDSGADLIDVRVSEHRLILRAVCKTSSLGDTIEISDCHDKRETQDCSPMESSESCNKTSKET